MIDREPLDYIKQPVYTACLRLLHRVVARVHIISSCPRRAKNLLARSPVCRRSMTRSRRVGSARRSDTRFAFPVKTFRTAKDKKKKKKNRKNPNLRKSSRSSRSSQRPSEHVTRSTPVQRIDASASLGIDRRRSPRDFISDALLCKAEGRSVGNDPWPDPSSNRPAPRSASPLRKENNSDLSPSAGIFGFSASFALYRFQPCYFHAWYW